MPSFTEVQAVSPPQRGTFLREPSPAGAVDFKGLPLESGKNLSVWLNDQTGTQVYTMSLVWQRALKRALWTCRVLTAGRQRWESVT